MTLQSQQSPAPRELSDTGEFPEQRVVVSGLPRSGTSMMMRSLETGGLFALTDAERVADRDNPNGYYEFELVKETRRDASWLKSARDRAVKMVYSLVYDLPADYRYDVVVMRRDMNEILASQRKMLERLGFEQGPPDAVMEKLFRKELRRFHDWAGEQPHIRLLEVQYADVVNQPKEQFDRIADFLNRPLDVDAMVDVIDPKLYRNRSQNRREAGQ